MKSFLQRGLFLLGAVLLLTGATALIVYPLWALALGNRRLYNVLIALLVCGGLAGLLLRRIRTLRRRRRRREPVPSFSETEPSLPLSEEDE